MATVVKIGGSLFDWPELAPRLRRFLAALDTPRILLVPGGGPTANAIRQLDRAHALGEETAHWLALRSLTLNAHFLAHLLPNTQVIDDWEACPPAWQAGRLPILDAYRFARADEGKPGCLPHCWNVTSDSVAARVAIVGPARRLLLLKSATIPDAISWQEAGERGLVDSFFEKLLRCARQGLETRAINLRARTGQ